MHYIFVNDYGEPGICQRVLNDPERTHPDEYVDIRVLIHWWWETIGCWY